MWMDDKGKKSRLSSPQYVDYVMTFVQKTANDEAIFPTKVKLIIYANSIISLQKYDSYQIIICNQLWNFFVPYFLIKYYIKLKL